MDAYFTLVRTLTVTLHGCLFHLGQNLDRHAKSLGNFNNDDEGRMLLKALKGVAFLPEQDVQDGWNELKVEFSSYFGAVADPFITYFEDYYLERSNRSFKISLWNCSQRHIKNIPRTNNYSESGNRAIKDTVGCTRPSFHKFPDKLIQLQAAQDMRLAQLRSNICPDLPRDPDSIDRDAAF